MRSSLTELLPVCGRVWNWLRDRLHVWILRNHLCQSNQGNGWIARMGEHATGAALVNSSRQDIPQRDFMGWLFQQGYTGLFTRWRRSLEGPYLHKRCDRSCWEWTGIWENPGWFAAFRELMSSPRPNNYGGWMLVPHVHTSSKLFQEWKRTGCRIVKTASFINHKHL